MAASIAISHHEKWDGSGYPYGIVGDDIPVEGRITAVADVFDALSSKRAYKGAFDLEKCFVELIQGQGNHFDPRVVRAFFERRDEILQVYHDYSDEPNAQEAVAATRAAHAIPLASSESQNTVAGATQFA